MTRPSTLYAILFLSGFAGLGYEMVWTRMLAVGLGHEVVAVLAVVAAFFCGMALGAWALDGKVSRSARPGRWYALLELAIGLWSLILIPLIPAANRLAASMMGSDPSQFRHWAVAFGLPFGLLLPVTFAMGATLPAMERLFSRLRRDGWSVAGLYAANTFGAVAGVMLTTFVISPHIGFKATAALLAAANFVCAAGVLLGAAAGEGKRPPVQSQSHEPVSSPRMLGTLFATGLLGIGYEVLVVRVASQVLENTVFSFAAFLSIYLLGTATGAAIYHRVAPRRQFNRVLTYLLEATSLFCLVGMLLLLQSDPIFQWLRAAAGNGVRGAVMGEIGLATAIFFLPTLAMGATFSHLAQGARQSTGGLGRAICMNTLGASIAPLLCSVWALPLLGVKWSLIVVSISYLMLIPTRRGIFWLPATAPIAVAGILGCHWADFNFVDLAPGSRIAVHMDGVMASVTVVEDRHNDYYLKVNNKFLMGGTASRFSDGRQGHIPLLLHPNPKRALFLGLGTGSTFAAGAAYPNLTADGVELVPEVITALPYFEKATGPLDSNPLLHLHVADARRFVNASDQTYDVIVADLFHPARDGAGYLYTVEHFKAIRALLASDGIFCQWLPLYQMDLDLLRVITRTFLHVFPDGVAFIATYSLETPIVGLVAGNSPLAYPPDYVAQRVGSEALYGKLQMYRLHRPYALLGGFIAGSQDLARFSTHAPLNTDDRPVVIFQAPRFAYSQKESAATRLLELIDHMAPSPQNILNLKQGPQQQRISERLAGYWRARNRFLKAGVGIGQTADVRQMLSQVQKPLLSIIRESPDFDAAYDPLIGMAQRLNAINPEAAQKLLLELESANPDRPEAGLIRKHFSRQ
jgi:spermidine synthase